MAMKYLEMGTNIVESTSLVGFMVGASITGLMVHIMMAIFPKAIVKDKENGSQLKEVAMFM